MQSQAKMQASVIADAGDSQDSRLPTARKKLLKPTKIQERQTVIMHQTSTGSIGSSCNNRATTTVLSLLTVLLYLTTNYPYGGGGGLVQALTLGTRLDNRDGDTLIPAEARFRLVTNAKPVIETSENINSVTSVNGERAEDDSQQVGGGSLSLRDRLAKFRESLQRRDRLKDLHETFKERIGGIRGARSTGDKVYKLNINLPVTKGGGSVTAHDADYSSAESKTKPSIAKANTVAGSNVGGDPVMASLQPATKMDAAAGGTNRLVNYDDSLQDGESIRKRFFTPLVESNDAGSLQSSAAQSNAVSFGNNPQFEHLAANLADSLFGYYPAAGRGQRTARSVNLISGQTVNNGAGFTPTTYEQLGSSPMVAHESPNFMPMNSNGQDPIQPLSLSSAMTASQQQPSTQSGLNGPEMEQAAMQHNQRIDDMSLSSKSSQRQQQQLSDHLGADTIWPTPTGEPFGFTAATPANGFGQRSSSSSANNKLSSNQRMQELAGDRSAGGQPSAARLDRFVVGEGGQELPMNNMNHGSKESSATLLHGAGSQSGDRPNNQLSSDPMRMASEEDYSMKSGHMNDYDEHGGSHEVVEAYKKSPKKSVDRYYSEDESHDSYETHAPKKIIIKKEEKHHHHHHHHHHHEPEKKHEEHKKHEKVHVQTQPLHLEIHIKGKSKSKMKNKGKGKGKDKSKAKNKDGDEIYVKLNQGGGHHHHGGHHGGGGGGHHMDGGGGHNGDDGSYVDENSSSGPGVIEDKKSLIDDSSDHTSAGDGAGSSKPHGMNTVAAGDGAAANTNAEADTNANVDAAADSKQGESAESEQQSGESKSTQDVEQEPDFDANQVINTSKVPKYFDIFGEELHDKEQGKSSDEGEKSAAEHESKEKESGGKSSEAGEQTSAGENHEGGHKEESKEANQESKQEEKHKKVEKKTVKKKKNNKKKGKKKEVIKEEKKEEQPVEQKEEKKEEHEEKKVKHEEEKKVEHEEEKKEEPEKKEEEQKHEEPAKKEVEEKKVYKNKHAHIEVHKHNHYEHHEHINVGHKPEVEHHQPELEQQHHQEHHPEMEHHEQHEHLGEHEHGGGHHHHEELDGLQQHDGGYEAPMMHHQHHHEPEHHHPINNEHWVAPVIHEKPSNQHHPHGAIVIEDHSLLEKHSIEHPEGPTHYKEEIINHPHGFGLTPVAAYNLMGAYSTQSTSTQADKSETDSGGKIKSSQQQNRQSGTTKQAPQGDGKKSAPEKPTRQ